MIKFPCFLELNSTLLETHIHCILFFHSSNDGHLHWFYILAIVSSSAINIRKMSLEQTNFIGFLLSSRIAGSCCSSKFKYKSLLRLKKNMKKFHIVSLNDDIKLYSHHHKHKWKHIVSHKYIQLLFVHQIKWWTHFKKSPGKAKKKKSKIG